MVTGNRGYYPDTNGKPTFTDALGGASQSISEFNYIRNAYGRYPGR